MTFFLVAVASFVRAGRVGRTRRQQSRSRFFPVALTPKPAARFWGKSKRNPFIMAVPLYSNSDRAKTRNSRPAIWENHLRTRLSWRFPHKKAALTPKPATRGRVGKIEWKTVYDGDFPGKKRLSRQNRRLSNGLGKIPAKPVYHGDREETRDPIGETIRIGEAVRHSEAARPRPTQNSEPPSFQGNAKSLASGHRTDTG